MDRVTSKPAFVAEALQLTGMPACACTADGIVFAANADLEALIGASVEGRRLDSLFHAKFAAGAPGHLAAAFAAPGQFGATLAGSDGGEIAVQVRTRPLPENAGVAGATFAFSDFRECERDKAALHTTLLEQRAILENAAIGVAFTKPGLIKSCNRRLAEMLGFTQQELNERPASALFATADRYERFTAEALAGLAAGGLFEKSEFSARRRDGSSFWARIRARAIDPGSREAGTIWIVEDVTAARQAMTEVRAIMDNASVSILFTKDRMITRYNRGFAQMFGYPESDMASMPARVLYAHDAAYEGVGKAAYPVLASDRPFHAETAMVRSDGARMWVQLIGYLVVPGEIEQGIVWIIEDRTRHKCDEESLRNALLENQAILDNAVLGIAVIEHGHTLRTNAKMDELFGYPLGGAAGVTVSSLYADEASWLAAREATARDFAAGQVHMAEYQLARKDGSRFWARLSGRPYDPSQPRGRSVWMVDDVTARREAADAVRRARDDLEVRVLERTGELAGANALLEAEIAERRQAEERVHHLAYYDSLTGLPNRVLLADRLQRAMFVARRNGRKLALMFLDLDRFKTINDSLGHMAGDHLLKEVGRRLVGAVRASDTVARLGGDEFVVVAPGVRSAEECAAIGDKIIDALAAPVPFEGHALHISPSIGICMYPDDGLDVDVLMRHADAAMYAAKAAGRNNYQFFTPHMNHAAARHFELESSLRSALANGEFELFYQPVIDTATRRVHALEALLRWRRPGLGLGMPDDFIPILEESGMIVPVGEWVIRSACEQSMAWQRAGLAPVPIAVNLSARQFMHRGLVDAVRAVIADTGIDPCLLEFEITETALMQHGEQTLEILGQIARMGIRLSIDDFGTGYSSLAYLKRFPVHTLKIDRAFVRELETSSEDQAIVAAITALSGSLQLSVVAEGVETEAQFALLRGRGCQFAQGYMFSRPVDVPAIERLLREQG